MISLDVNGLTGKRKACVFVKEQLTCLLTNPSVRHVQVTDVL